MLRPHLAATVALLHDGAVVACWPLDVDGQVDLTVAEQLARMQLAARRMRMSIALRQPIPDLVGLLELVGLTCVLPTSTDESIEVSGEAELGEEVGVEEAVVADDPPA